MSWHPHPIAVALAVIMLIVAVWFGVQGRHTRGRTATTILDVLLAVLVGLISLHLSLIHISEPTRREWLSRMPSSA